MWLFRCNSVKVTQGYKLISSTITVALTGTAATILHRAPENRASTSDSSQQLCDAEEGSFGVVAQDTLFLRLLWREQGSPENGGLSGSLTGPDISPQVQLDTLPGMSLVAGKALSSARMSDAVLSQASLMGSQQFQDGEDEGKALPTGSPGQFPRGAAPDFCGNDHCVKCYTQSHSPHISLRVCVSGALASVSTGPSQSRFSAAAGGPFRKSSLSASPWRVSHPS